MTADTLAPRASPREHPEHVFPRKNRLKMALLAIVNLPVAAMFAWIALNGHITGGTCDGRRRLTCLLFKAIFEALPPYAENVFGGIMFFLFLGIIGVLLRESVNRRAMFSLSPEGIKGRLAFRAPWFVKWDDVLSLERRNYGVEIRASHAAHVPWWIRRRKDGYVLGLAHKDVGLSAEDLLAEITHYRDEVRGSSA
jgi:hypothetical protein